MASGKEAVARIKINRLLEAVGWRFFDDKNGSANIILELHSKIQKSELDALGANFEDAKDGFIDFLLLNEIRGITRMPAITIIVHTPNPFPVKSKPRTMQAQDSSVQ